MVFTTDSQSCRQPKSVGKITNAPNDIIFKMTINENDEQIGAEMMEMTTIFSLSMGANTRFNKIQKDF